MTDTAATTPPHAGAGWTTRSLLAWMDGAFQRAGMESPRLCAEMLLAHVLGCERLRLYMDSDRPAGDDERARLRDLAARALRHEPVQHLVGEAWFFSLPFRVDKRVLVPRPSTETGVDLALRHARTHDALSRGVVADVCTGSGCVAIALLKNLPDARAVATDISPDALEVARANGARHGVEARLDLREGDLLAPLAGQSFDALIANPPYIPDDEWEGVPDNVRLYEPELALRAGPDGLAAVRPLLVGAPGALAPGGLLVVEVAQSRAAEALAIAEAQPGLVGARVERDAEGRDRFIVAQRRG